MLLRLEVPDLIRVVQQNLRRIDRIGDTQETVLIRACYVYALTWERRFHDALAAQAVVSAIARRIGDVRSLAYSLASEIAVSTIVAPKPVEVAEALSRQAIDVASKTDDPYIQLHTRAAVAWDEVHRGRTVNAERIAQQLIEAGRRFNDPRATGLALGLLSWIAILGDDYSKALRCSEEGVRIALTTFDRIFSTNGMAVALVLLRQIQRGGAILEDFRRQSTEKGWGYSFCGNDAVWGVLLVLRGRIRDGVRWIERSIKVRESEGYRLVADWYRLSLCEIYLEIVASKERPALNLLLRNAFTLLRLALVAPTRIIALVAQVRQNPQLDPNGHFIGRAEMILGLLYKAKRERALAVRHLAEAHRIVAPLGETPMLAKIETALAELRS